MLRYGLGARSALGYGLGVSAPGGAALWYRAGGAPLPVAAYQPKGAADLAASYVNLANPGTYNAAPGVAPSFDAATGWTFNGSTQYLTTGVTPSDTNFAMLIRFADTTASGVPIGVYRAAPNRFYNFYVTKDASVTFSFGSNFTVIPGTFNSGVLGYAALTGYKNGLSIGAVGAVGNTPDSDIYIGTRNDAVLFLFYAGKIQAVAIWNTSTNHAIWMPAVSAAMALI